jgi:hypothetical protein
MSRVAGDSSRPTRVSYLDIISSVHECKRNRRLMQPSREVTSSLVMRCDYRHVSPLRNRRQDSKRPSAGLAVLGKLGCFTRAETAH